MFITIYMLNCKRILLNAKVGNCVWSRKMIEFETEGVKENKCYEVFLGITSDQYHLFKSNQKYNILVKPARIYHDEYFKVLFDINGNFKGSLMDVILKFPVTNS